MATSYPYKFYNFNGDLSVLPATNTPFGATEVGFSEALSTQLRKLQSVRPSNDPELLRFKDLYSRFQSGGLTDTDFSWLSQNFWRDLSPTNLKSISSGGQVASPFSNWNGAIVESSKIPELESQGATVQGGNVVGSSVPGLGGTPGTPPQLTQDVFNQTMSSMQNKGLTLNPNANLDDPQTIAEFLKIAEGEVEPYYKSQLKVARDQFLRQQGYDTDSILKTEAELQRKYGAQVRDLAASSAESGFAQSGKRVEGERNLAMDTQGTIDANRRQLGFQGYQQAGTYAQTYGGLLGEKAPQGPSIANAPRVLAGVEQFQQGGSSPYYTLSNDVYDSLIGTSEKERVTGNRALAQDREELYRTNQSQTRNLI